jgi:hypothetical protein
MNIRLPGSVQWLDVKLAENRRIGGGVERMKIFYSVLPRALAAITVAAVCCGGLGSNAQTIPAATTVPASPPAVGAAHAPALSYAVGDVLKMYQGGINKDIITDYIKNSALSYRLDADAIIYLQTLGLPQEITRAMLQRDGQLQQQQQAYRQSYQQQPMPAPYGAAPPQQPMPVVTPATPAPAVPVIGSDYPDYGYGYPYYSTPYYWPPVVIGGWGWGFGGFRGGFGGFRGGFGGFRGGGFGGFHGGFGGFHAGGHGGGHR